MSRADIVVGIAGFQDAAAISRAVCVVDAGLAKYFPQYTAVIVNPAAGTHLLPVSHPPSGSAIRVILQTAGLLRARACAVVEAGLGSLTPEWVDLLVRPVLHAGFDFVAPHYHRHKFDGAITNSIVYPLTRALYGYRVRPPTGGDFGISNHLLARCLERNDWESGAARYGSGVWITTIAVSEGFRICQSCLGAGWHAAIGSGAGLAAVLKHLAGTVFSLMEEYEPVWRRRNGSRDVDLFGRPLDLSIDPIEAGVEGMLRLFRNACTGLREIWALAMQPGVCREVLALASRASPEHFRLSDELWVRIIYDFACAHKNRSLDRGHLLGSLAPLYLARAASFMLETETLYSAGVEERIERLCRVYEELKPYLVANWTGTPIRPAVPSPVAARAPTSGDVSHAVDTA